MASQLTWLFGAGRTFAARNRCPTATIQCAVTIRRIRGAGLSSWMVFPSDESRSLWPGKKPQFPSSLFSTVQAALEGLSTRNRATNEGREFESLRAHHFRSFSRSAPTRLFSREQRPWPSLPVNLRCLKKFSSYTDSRLASRHSVGTHSRSVPEKMDPLVVQHSVDPLFRSKSRAASVAPTVAFINRQGSKVRLSSVE